MDHLSAIERAERIDRYLSGELTAEETQAFEAALARDPQLHQEMEDVSLARTLAQDYGLRHEIKSIRQAMHEEATATPREADRLPPLPSTPPEPGSDNVRPLWRTPAYVGRIAAGIAILLVGFLALQWATLSADSLYAEKAVYYQVAASRSAEPSATTSEDRLEQQYQSQRFTEAITTYEALPNPSLMATFLAGNAYLQNEQADQAIEAFQAIVTINGTQGINRFEEDAQYYLALSYLKAERPADALPLLEAINANPEHSYHTMVNDYYLWKVRTLNRIS